MSKKKDTAIYNTEEITDCPNCGLRIEVKRREWIDRQLPLLQQLGLMLIGGIIGFIGCLAYLANFG